MTDAVTARGMTLEALARYQPNDAKIAELAAIYNELKVSGEDDAEGCSVVRRARLDIRSMRIEVEKTRKELKADALRYSQAVDGEARRLTALLTPIEKRLQGQEDIVAKAAERKRQAAAVAAAEELRRRMDALAAIGSHMIPEDVREMDEEAFLAALAVAQQAHDDRIAAEAAAAAEREREAQQLAAERVELDRQRAEDAARRKAAADALEAERAEERAKQKAIADAMAAERAALDAERLEQQRLADAKATEERVRWEAEESAAKAREAAAQQEARRPTSQKLLALAHAVEDLLDNVPEFDGADAVRTILTRAADFIRGTIN